MSVTLRIARYGVRDLVRSRWLIAYGAFFFLATTLLLRFSGVGEQALLSLVNVVLFVVPLANIVFGTMYLYASREFVELLLAQPVRRRQLFGGLYLGLTLPIAAAAVAGIGLPLLMQGAGRATVMVAIVIAVVAALLSAVFTALAAVITYAIEDRVRGLAAAIGAWLVLAVVYDAVVLLGAVQFADYPLERPLLGLMIANPIDLARLLLLVRLDAGALLGYTGAVFQQAFAGAAGLMVAAAALLLWALVPAVAGARLFYRKDF